MAHQTTSSFLQQLSLERYSSLLDDEGYERVGDLRGVPLEELTALGMKKGHARRVVNAMVDLFEGPSGEPGAVDEKQPEYTGPKKTVSLLLYGQTGVGKSTLLKSLADFINGVPFENVTITPKTAAKGESQTQLSTLDNYNNREWNVDIIDTPGIGDTNGTEVDDGHMNNIADYLNDKEFNAVCVLIKRGETRSVNLLRYVINELRANMPKDVARNFIIIMTRAEVPVPDADTMAVIQSLGLPVDNIIPINNIAYEEMDLSHFSEGSAAYESIISKQRTNYHENHGNLRRLLELARGFSPYQGNNVVALKRKRNKLNEEVGLLMKKLDDTAEMERTLDRQQHLLEEAKRDESQARSALMKTESVTKKKYERQGGVIRTWCSACYVDCHMDCRLSWNSDLTHCAAMSGSSCRTCGHSVSTHKHKGWVEVPYTESRTYKDPHKLAEMNKAQRLATQIQQRSAQINAEMRQNLQRREQLVQRIRDMYQELESIAILGWNDSYEKYMLECKKAVEKDARLSQDQKEQKLGIFERALQQVYVLKEAVGL